MYHEIHSLWCDATVTTETDTLMTESPVERYGVNRSLSDSH
jgi:hypothetical protein